MSGLMLLGLALLALLAALGMSAADRRPALPRRRHRHIFRPDWIDTDDERCWCGARRPDGDE